MKGVIVAGLPGLARRRPARRVRVPAVAAVVATAFAISGGVATAHAEMVREAYQLFGSLVEISVESADRETAQNRIRDAMTVARRTEAALDAARDDSALARLNAKAGRGPLRVPLDLYRLLAFSKLMTRSTGGTFDVTVGPLVLRRQSAPGERGARTSVGDALALVGSDRIVLHPPELAELADEGMALDVTAVARGYTLERMAAELRAIGVTKALFEFADTTAVAIGPPPEEPPFRIRITRGKSTIGSVALRDRAVATARAGRRHDDSAPTSIVDPRSGRFVDAERQATVVALDAAIAEAWSTALVVDPDGALGLLEEPRDAEALVFDEHGEHRTPRFDRFAGWNDGSGRVVAGSPAPAPESAAQQPAPAAVAPR